MHGAFSLAGATHTKDVSVKLDQFFRTRRFMQAVDILRNDRATEGADGDMCGVGLGGANQPPSPLVPLPHERRISVEGFGGGEILGSKVPPQPSGAAKRRNAAV